MILNISRDHIDWHGSKKNYIKSKIRIFNNQTKKDVAILNDINLKNTYKKKIFWENLNFLKRSNQFKTQS